MVDRFLDRRRKGLMDGVGRYRHRRLLHDINQRIALGLLLTRNTRLFLGYMRKCPLSKPSIVGGLNLLSASE